MCNIYSFCPPSLPCPLFPSEIWESFSRNAFAEFRSHVFHQNSIFKVISSKSIFAGDEKRIMCSFKNDYEWIIDSDFCLVCFVTQECKVWRLLRNSVWALLWFFQCMWGWALCPGHKEQGLWKGQSLWDSSEPRTEKASFPVLQSKTHGGLISLVSSLGNVFTKLHLTE